MSADKEKSLKISFMNYELEPWQDALINYLLPSVTSLIFYILLLASDVALVFRHYKDENPIWASVTLFLLFLPSLFSFIVVISSWELWPEMEDCGRDNCLWFIKKTCEHLFFPVWAMWRYAEKIFWSIEAVRAMKDEKFIADALKIISAPRTIELYFFFQAFLHSLPQMLLQLNILMKQDYIVEKQTADAVILSFVFNMMKVAATIAFYQRFKTQKLAGKQYPWYKPYKQKYNVDQVDSMPPLQVDASRPISSINEEPELSVSRRSSDFYLEPELRELRLIDTLRETSILDGPKRIVYQEISEPDFNIRRIESIKGLPEDDLAGKLVSFCWWSCFLLARILAISAFFYFYSSATLWMMFAHFTIVVAFLIYDAKTDYVKKKAVFVIFIGLIYVFCIIEFKIRFKKTKFMYGGYFTLVFVENFIMCMVWWFKNVEDLENDFWFRYMFYIIILGSMISVTSMMLYLSIYKPKKIVVGHRYKK